MLTARWLLPLLAVVGATGGCSGETEAEVDRAAASFYSALADADGRTACGLLAPGTRSELESSSGEPCPEAVLAEVDGATDDPTVTVSGSAARVRVGADTAFLAEYDEGWLVVAAGCAAPPAPDRPYDCRVQGG